jgi:hypothetical protein
MIPDLAKNGIQFFAYLSPFKSLPSNGSFYRSFTLPGTIDQEKIRAEYKDGVLTLTLPKREEIKPKQIKVAISEASR